jgi:hypothetical protein
MIGDREHDVQGAGAAAIVETVADLRKSLLG